MLAPAIRRHLNLGPMAMGAVFTAFVWGYALLHIPAGWLGDRLGARRVLAAVMVLRPTFTVATAAAWSLASLVRARRVFMKRSTR